MRITCREAADCSAFWGAHCHMMACLVTVENLFIIFLVDQFNIQHKKKKWFSWSSLESFLQLNEFSQWIEFIFFIQVQHGQRRHCATVSRLKTDVFKSNFTLFSLFETIFFCWSDFNSKYDLELLTKYTQNVMFL